MVAEEHMVGLLELQYPHRRSGLVPLLCDNSDLIAVKKYGPSRSSALNLRHPICVGHGSYERFGLCEAVNLDILLVRCLHIVSRANGITCNANSEGRPITEDLECEFHFLENVELVHPLPASAEGYYRDRVHTNKKRRQHSGW